MQSSNSSVKKLLSYGNFNNINTLLHKQNYSEREREREEADRGTTHKNTN